jgi:hypothetical protein
MKPLLIKLSALILLLVLSHSYLWAFNRGHAAGISSVEARLAERKTDLEALKLATENCITWKERYEEMGSLITTYFDAEDEIRDIRVRGLVQ